MTITLRKCLALGVTGSGMFGALSCGHSAHVDRSPFAWEMAQSMERMKRDMAAAPMTGDPGHDFAAMMIPHHQGAVDMARILLAQRGGDPALRRLAQEIVVTQQQEMDLMSRRIAALSPPPAGPTSTAAGRIRVSGQDRVYTADQTSNTVSVLNPATNRLLGVIRLGDTVPGALNPLYKGQLLVHGMGFSPDHRTLCVVSIGSNSVTLIDTATNKVKGVVYIGRAPHEAFFTPDGKEVWATVRGQDYVSVIDPVAMKEKRRVVTANGPGMVLFHPQGRYAYVPSSFTPEVDVVDTRTYQVIARIPQASPFSPNLSVTRDGKEVWFTLKDSGKTQVMSGEPPFRILTTLNTGPITNHVTTVDNAKGQFAYVTVGGENKVKVYRRGGANPQQVATIAVGDLPHGVWGSGDGTRVYVGLENQDAVAAIDTLTNQVIATIPIGQQPMALVYVPGAVPTGNGTANLASRGSAGISSHLTMTAPQGSGHQGHATVSVNGMGPLDTLEIAASGLTPGKTYTLWLVTSRTPPFGHKQALATFTTNISGSQIAQAIGPLREPLAPNNRDRQRYLLLTLKDSTTPVLVQQTP
ncbi:DUF305 domain-containing protein [Acrocarpospora catenulata]|uniref:DUF305 domain-containing protein n=1 Tax=Acrocarpospora catenulata TaxID=2836182 RepID=UPI0027E16F86|nr:DUF305 domain-containing protein [Acrocarpospora catenulata]